MDANMAEFAKKLEELVNYAKSKKRWFWNTMRSSRFLEILN